MKSAIASLFTALTDRPHSHSSGFARIFSEQLKVAGIEHDWILSADKDKDWNDYDVIYLYQGLDLNGKLGMNLFGGACEANWKILRKLGLFRGKIKPIVYPLADYHALVERGWHLPIEYKREWEDIWKQIKNHQDNTKHKDIVDNPTGSHHLCIGDSHIPSMWRHGTHIRVLSGKTLHSALETGLGQLLDRRYTAATFYFGNIDIRHHLARLPGDPVLNAIGLANDYINQLRQIRPGLNFLEVCELLPIEDESREIPGPGHYKGKPFHGDWQTRNEMRTAFNEVLFDACRRLNIQYAAHPKQFTGPDGKMDQAYMERPRSVHVAPMYYRAFSKIHPH
jgi:hypothetical protein